MPFVAPSGDVEQKNKIGIQQRVPEQSLANMRAPVSQRFLPLLMSFMEAISPVLLLLAHLRILQFPHIANPEYDSDLFDSTRRGMRERTKAMEDISFFLVELLEGGREKARMVRYMRALCRVSFHNIRCSRRTLARPPPKPWLFAPC